MTSTWRKLAYVSIVCMQVLFLVVFFCFREIPVWGLGLFHTSTSEDMEWNRQNPGHPYGDRIVALVYLFITILYPIMGMALSDHYKALFKSRQLRAADILITAAVLALYAPLFYYIKYRAEHFYLWMQIVPVEVLSLILLALLLYARDRGRLPDKE